MKILNKLTRFWKSFDKLLLFSVLISVAFFVAGLLTLTHYGTNWDTINHLPRGQAYLRYFLTGKKDYSDLPKLFSDWDNTSEWYFQDPRSLSIKTNLPENSAPERSLYQTDSLDFNYFVKNDGFGHPPLSDILSSVFNRILFAKLRLINDIDSYRVYGVLLAAATVGLSFYWVAKVYGFLPGLISALAISLYPFFWAEAHFNTEKDIPVAFFWVFFMYSFWRGITGRSWRWIITSGIVFGMALGTKFNILFSVFVVVPWLGFFIFTNWPKLKKYVATKPSKTFKVILAIGIALLIPVLILFVSWPYLWPDPLGRIQKTIGFYKEIGLTGSFDPRFLGPFGTSLYPIQWIIFTTPLVTLLFSATGIVFSIYRIITKKDNFAFLILAWLLVPIARVTWPGTTVYGGGIRQIIEFIPALTISAGLGAGFLQKLLDNFIFVKIRKIKLSKLAIVSGCLLVLSFLPITLKIISIHPNENVYFNFLIGGLKGAKQRDFPFWGHSFGAPYRQGVVWLNENTEENAKIVYVYELIPNIPRIFLRPDLKLGNQQRSGYLMDGEYAITLTYQGTNKRSYYDMYLETFLKPVYLVEVDGVAILKIWRNSYQHLSFPIEEEVLRNVGLEKKQNSLKFDLGSPKRLYRLEIEYDDVGCPDLESGYVNISKDGIKWERLPGVLPEDWRISSLGQQPKGGKFIEPFVGQEARFIELILSPPGTCLRNVRSFKVISLK